MPKPTIVPQPSLSPADAQVLAASWLARRQQLQVLEAQQKQDEQSLLDYFKTVDERTVGGVTCWSRSYTDTDLVPVNKKDDREALVAGLLSDEVFTAFIGERVNGASVLERASEDKTFRNTLEKRELIERHLDIAMLAKAAEKNVQLQAALKAHRLVPSVSVSHKYYLKA